MKKVILICVLALIAISSLVWGAPNPELEQRIASVIDQNRNAVDYFMTAHAKILEYTGVPPYLADANMVLISSANYRALLTLGCYHDSYYCTDAAADAAVATASHAMLTHLYPSWNLFQQSITRSFFRNIPDEWGKDYGAKVGELVARQVLEHESLDNRGTYNDIEDPNQEGLWSPTPPTYLPYTGSFLANLTLRVLNDPEEVPARAPPSLNSAEFTRDLEEVRLLGREDSVNRTVKETQEAIAFDFLCDQIQFGIVKYAQDLGLDMRQSATFYMIVATSGYEAHVLTHYYKTVFLAPRPVTVIQEGLPTIRPDIPVDPSWMPLGNTPANAEHPSGTVALTTGYMNAIKMLVGDTQPFSIIMPLPNDVVDIPLPFTYPNLDGVIQGSMTGRVTVGVHFTYSCKAGRDQALSASQLIVNRMCRHGRCLDKHNPTTIPYRFL